MARRRSRAPSGWIELALAALCALARPDRAQPKPIQPGLTPEDWKYTLADGRHLSGSHLL